MLSPLVAVATTGLLGWRTSVPRPSRQYGQAIAGVAVGLYFTPALMTTLLPDLPAIGTTPESRRAMFRVITSDRTA